MSSHHFVREGQEPALIIANGSSCSDQLLFELLEWSPFVLVLDGALERVLSKGIKFDAVLGDFDSSDELHQRLDYLQPLELLHRPDQNKTDLEKGLDYLFEEKQIPHARIVWASGKRSDHFLNNLFTLGKYAQQMNLVMLDDHSQMFILPQKFSKHYPKGQIISLMPLTEVHGVKTQNLVYSLNDEQLSPLHRTGSSNEVAETGLVHIEHHTGTLLLIEARD